MRVACWSLEEALSFCRRRQARREGQQAKKQANQHKLNKRWDLERETIVYEVIH